MNHSFGSVLSVPIHGIMFTFSVFHYTRKTYRCAEPAKNWKLKMENWKLLVDSWKLIVESGELIVDSWKLKAEIEERWATPLIVSYLFLAWWADINNRSPAWTFRVSWMNHSFCFLLSVPIHGIMFTSSVFRYTRKTYRCAEPLLTYVLSFSTYRCAELAQNGTDTGVVDRVHELG